jgi:hypothetical protein
MLFIPALIVWGAAAILVCKACGHRHCCCKTETVVVQSAPAPVQTQR